MVVFIVSINQIFILIKGQQAFPSISEGPLMLVKLLLQTMEILVTGEVIAEHALHQTILDRMLKLDCSLLVVEQDSILGILENNSSKLSVVLGLRMAHSLCRSLRIKSKAATNDHVLLKLSQKLRSEIMVVGGCPTIQM